jgi:hypothetical protein
MERTKKPRPRPGLFRAWRRRELSYIAGTKFGTISWPFPCNRSAVRAAITVYIDTARETFPEMLSLT